MSVISEIEFQVPETVKQFQEQGLRTLLLYLSEQSPFYKRHFTENGISVSTVKTLEDLHLIPTISKDDLQRNNWDFICIPRREIAEYTSTSGTSGKPVTVALSKNDLDRLAYNECLSFSCAGADAGDLYQLMLTLDRQFMAGMAYYNGLHKLDAGVIRTGAGLPAMQLEAIRNLQPDAVVAVPSFVIKLIEFAQETGCDLGTTSVRKIICIGENIRNADFELNALGKKIRSSWNVELLSTYASTEMQTAFTECAHGRGGHHHPELLIVEFLDDDGKHVLDGSPGELTITTLGIEGMPLLRFRTGDIAIAHREKCACGRTSLRISPILGRKQQMLKLKGTTLFPQGIFDLVNSLDFIEDYTVEAITGPMDTDEINVHLLAGTADEVHVLKKLREAFQSQLRVVPNILFVTRVELDKLQAQGLSRKVSKFIDHRKSYISQVAGQ